MDSGILSVSARGCFFSHNSMCNFQLLLPFSRLVLFGSMDLAGLQASLKAAGHSVLRRHWSHRGRTGVHIVCPKPTCSFAKRPPADEWVEWTYYCNEQYLSKIWTTYLALWGVFAFKSLPILTVIHEKPRRRRKYKYMDWNLQVEDWFPPTPPVEARLQELSLFPLGFWFSNKIYATLMNLELKYIKLQYKHVHKKRCPQK